MATMEFALGPIWFRRKLEEIMNLHDHLVLLAIAVIVAALIWFFFEFEVRIERDDNEDL